MLHFLPSWLPWAAFMPLVLRLARRFPVQGGGWAIALGVHGGGAVFFGLAHLFLLGLVRTNFPPGAWADVGLGTWMVQNLWSLQAQAEVLAYAGVVAGRAHLGHGRRGVPP